MRSNTTARLLLLTALIVAAAAHAQPAVDEAAVQAELDALTTDVEALEPTYLAAAALERRYQFTARLSDGQLFFLTGDYDRAAMVLLDLVTNPSSQTHPAYRDALYYLAESLYLTRNYKASAGWFDHVAERGDPAQRQHAVARQLEIALRLGDGPAAERALKRARVLLDSTADSTLRYAVGKYHFRTGDLAGAAEHFALIPPGSPDYSRARYFLGVIETAGRHFDAALAHFDAVIASPAVNGEADPTRLARVRDEALLARARIFYEQGRLGDAIGAYNQVPRDSSLFEQAMSESVWISIKEGAYDKALRKLEILLISQPDIRKGHEARLLRGKLLMMLGRHGEAIEAFEEVRREFEPMQQDMRDVTRAHADLEAHFNEVIGANIEEFDLDSFLPEEAAEFAGPDAEADRALQLVGDLAAEQRDVEDARRTLDRLDVALAADSRVEIYPRLHEGWLKATEARARIVALRGQLNDLAARHLTERGEDLDARHAERQEWADRYAAVPRSALALQARDARVDDSMAGVDREAFRLELEIRALDAQLVAIDKYVRDTTREAGMRLKDEAARSQVEREKAEAHALRARLEKLIAAIEAERIRVGVNDYASREDDRLRRHFLAAVEAEAEALRKHGAPVNPGARARLDRLDQLLDGFFRRAGGLIDERLDDIRRQIGNERQRVDGYTATLGGVRGDTESLGGAIAARSFRHVMERIEAVILEADVGIIDVAWKQKDDRTERINGFRDKQRTEFERLDAAYTEPTGAAPLPAEGQGD